MISGIFQICIQRVCFSDYFVSYLLIDIFPRDNLDLMFLLVFSSPFPSSEYGAVIVFHTKMCKQFLIDLKLRKKRNLIN